MNVKNILPFAFPFGIGGPKMKRRVKVSLELCIQVYMQLSLLQFMEGPTILVMNHIYNRQMSYKSGVMTCRSNVGGITLGEKLSMLSTESLLWEGDLGRMANLRTRRQARSGACRAEATSIS